VRRGTKLDPLLFGGSHENERRAGTENVAAIVGMAKAAELAMAKMGEEQSRFVRAHRTPRCRHRRTDRRGTSQWTSQTADWEHGELQVLVAAKKKGCCSDLIWRASQYPAVPACAVGSLEPSHVLKAMESPTNWRAPPCGSRSARTTRPRMWIWSLRQPRAWSNGYGRLPSRRDARETAGQTPVACTGSRRAGVIRRTECGCLSARVADDALCFNGTRSESPQTLFRPWQNRRAFSGG